jgi:hypothetical protein
VVANEPELLRHVREASRVRPWRVAPFEDRRRGDGDAHLAGLSPIALPERGQIDVLVEDRLRRDVDGAFCDKPQVNDGWECPLSSFDIRCDGSAPAKPTPYGCGSAEDL